MGIACCPPKDPDGCMEIGFHSDQIHGGVNSEECQGKRKRNSTCDKEVDRARGNMNAKGCQGKKKKYYNGGKKKKRKSEIKLQPGDVILYQCAGKIFRGIVKQKSENHQNAYIVYPNENCAGDRFDYVTWQSYPTTMDSLRITEDDLVLGNTVLISWQEYENGFVELIPAQVVEVQERTCWVKPHSSKSKVCVHVTLDEVCRTFKQTQILHGNVQVDSVDSEESRLSATQLILSVTQQQFEQLLFTHERTKEKLHASRLSEQELRKRNMELDQLLVDALTTVGTLEKELNARVNTDQVDNTLYQVISRQKDELDFKSHELLTANNKLETLREKYQYLHEQLEKSQKEAQKHITELRQRNIELVNSNEHLAKETVTLKGRLDEMLCDRGKFLEKRPNLTPGADLSVRVNGQKTQSFLKLSDIKVPSSRADEKTLKLRADRLSKVRQHSFFVPILPVKLFSNQEIELHVPECIHVSHVHMFKSFCLLV